MKLRSGKVIIIKNNNGLMSSKTLIEYDNDNENVNICVKKKINNKSSDCIRQIILESLKKCVNIKFE